MYDKAGRQIKLPPRFVVHYPLPGSLMTLFPPIPPAQYAIMGMLCGLICVGARRPAFTS